MPSFKVQLQEKLAHALTYAQARDALARMAGSHRGLEWLEDEIAKIDPSDLFNQMKAETV